MVLLQSPFDPSLDESVYVCVISQHLLLKHKMVHLHGPSNPNLHESVYFCEGNITPPLLKTMSFNWKYTGTVLDLFSVQLLDSPPH